MSEDILGRASFRGGLARLARPTGREAAALGRELRLDGPIALFVGSGFARKGLDRAISGLARGGVKASLLVVGAGDTGPYERQARASGLAERVRFLGVRDDVERLHAVADLLLLPTRYDAFGNVVLEAMASGLPVATTRTNGASELIRDGENGLVCEESFAPAFAALDDPAALRRLGGAARSTAEEHTWAHHAERVLELYRKVAG